MAADPGKRRWLRPSARHARLARLPSLGQDVIRREILGVVGDAGGHPVGLIDQTARYLLDQGLDVIVEGVLHPEHYAGPLRQLVADHHGVSRSYAYDLPFDETVRRHATRPLAAQFGPDEMRRWWRGFEPIPGLDEHLITTAASLEATVTRVLRDCRPVAR